MDREALGIVGDDTVFSITSGGCNVLAFLADSPRKIIALDLNPYQNYLLDLKINCFRYLEYDKILELLGVSPSAQRQALYMQIRDGLKAESRYYWDRQRRKIEDGIIHSGRFEKYMRMIRVLLKLTIGKRAIGDMFEAKDSSERESIFKSKWNNLRWRFLTKAILSRSVMSVLFTKAFFAQLGANFSFGDHFAGRAQRAIISLNPRESSFLTYILLGNYPFEEGLPQYLRKHNYDRIRKNLDRVELVTGSCGEYFASLPPDSISKFNFTNIFEWITKDEFESLLRETVRVAKQNAVMTYRNLLVHREHPRSLDRFIKSGRILATALHESDRSFIYDSYVVESIEKEKQTWNIRLSKQTAEV